MTGVTGVAGVLLFAEPARVEALAAFYRDVLALPPRTTRPGFQSFAWGGFRLTITGHDRVHGPSREPHRTMLNLAVEGIEDLHARLAGAGVPVVRPPEREPWGGVVCTVEDPDGNLVQLFELPS